MNELRFGTAGIPLSTLKGGSLQGVEQVRKLGLGCMELEFVRGVRMTVPVARQVREIAEKNDVVLTAHGPYYINLNSKDPSITKASAQRIIDTARIADKCGAYSITFHAAYYMKEPKEKVYEIVKTQMSGIIKQIRNENIKLWIRPETTGKGTQFGDVDEIIRLSQELDQVLPCVDFAHLHARSGGKINSLVEFKGVLAKLEKGLGKEALKNMHIHMSGIAYSEKGERKHLILRESDIAYKELMRAFKEYGCKGVVINESPNIEEDALLMKKIYDSI